MQAPSSLASLTPGSVLGGYLVEARLGSGGMGEVWRARDPSLLRSVALKVLSPEANASPSTRARFVREGRAAAALVHPNVVTVFGAGEDAGRTYLVMELVEGRTFRIASPGAPDHVKLGWLLDIARALGAVHQAGFVHRDVKPDNVMVTSAGAVKLLDFGIARAPSIPTDGPPSLAQTGTGQVMGTPRYITPEQWRGGPAVDGRTDQFAWAVMAYEALAGRHPDDASPGFGRVADWRAPAAPLHTLAPNLPFGVSAIVARALAVFPGARFATMEALCAELEGCLARHAAASGGHVSSGHAAIGHAPERSAFTPGVGLGSPLDTPIGAPTLLDPPWRDAPAAPRGGRAAVFVGAVLAVPLLALAAVGIVLVVRGAVSTAAPASAVVDAAPAASAAPLVTTTAPAVSSMPDAGTIAAQPVQRRAAAPTSPTPPTSPTSPTSAPSGSAAPAPTTLCARYTGVTVDASEAWTPPDAARTAWERALAAPLLACVRAAPDRFCRGTALGVGIEIETSKSGLQGYVLGMSADSGPVSHDSPLAMCIARALPNAAPKPVTSRRYSGRLKLRFTP